jgi:hypothetical protein
VSGEQIQVISLLEYSENMCLNDIQLKKFLPAAPAVPSPLRGERSEMANASHLQTSSLLLRS